MLREGLEENDLKDRVDQEIHFDEYVPKMGEEEAIIVASIKVFGKQAATDLENFIEKGYPWVLDADVSPGEISDNNYLVFIEADRDTNFPDQFMDFLEDLKNLTDVDANKYKMVYFKTESEKQVIPLTIETMSDAIPLTPKAYLDLKDSYGLLESMTTIAHVKPKRAKPFTRRQR